MSTINNKRRILLTPTEIKALYALPRLTQLQREQYFSLTDAEWDEVKQLKQLKSRLYLILAIGYFRVKPIVMRFRIKEVKEDIAYIVERNYPAGKVPRSLPSQSHCYYLDRKLLSIMNYQRLRSDKYKSKLSLHLENAKLEARNKALERVDVLLDHMQIILPLLKLFTDSMIADSTVFGHVRKQVFNVISPKKLVDLCELLEQSKHDKTESRWTYCDNNHATIKNQLRDVFLCLGLDLRDADPSLRKQLQCLKSELTAYNKVKAIDQRSLPKRVKPYLCQGGEINVQRYEWYLYQGLHQALADGKVYVVESGKHKQLEDDLISQKDWKNKDKWIIKTGLSKLITPIEHTLDAMGQQAQ